MAIKFISNYSKRLGLPGYSSHQFSVSVETELTDLERVPGEVARLYQLLQLSVDREIQQTGFVPSDGYGETPRALPLNGGNDPHPHGDEPEAEPTWQCSERQRELITELAAELNLDSASLDKRSQRLFRRPAHQLNKLCASGIISDLLAEAGTRRQREGRTGGNEGRGNGPTHAPRNGNGSGHGYGSGRSAPHRNGGDA